VSAGLLIRSFVKLTTVDKGYEASNVLAFQPLFPGDYPMARKADLIDTLLTRFRSHPDVQFAGFSRAGVLIGEEITMGLFVPHGRSSEEMRGNAVQPRLRSVSSGFLPAMGIRFIAGRDLDSSASRPEVVLNQSAAMHFFGQRGRGVDEIIDWQLHTRTVQVHVVGVVQDVRNESLEHEPFPEVFLGPLQLWAASQDAGESIPYQNQTAFGVNSFAIRTKNAPELVMPAIGQIVRAVDPNVGIDAIIPVTELVSTSVARHRFYAVLLGAFAAVAAILAAIGVYGVLAYAVTLRTQEIGIRMALGAERRTVLRLILQHGLILTTVGVTLGLVGARVTTRLLEGMLFGITPLDTLTFVTVGVLFSVVAMCASYLPARRATAVNPIVALRVE
jgi:predicted permease